MVNIMKLLRQKKQKQEEKKSFISADQYPLKLFREKLKSGQVDHEFFLVYSEFSKISGDRNADLQFIKLKQRALKRHRITYMQTLLYLYCAFPTPELKNMVITEGFKVFETPEQTYKSGMGKIKKMADDLKIEESEDIRDDGGDIDELIVELERFQGYQFNQDTMSVTQFAYIFKRYKEHGRKN